jgi:hypothetical protein
MDAVRHLAESFLADRAEAPVNVSGPLRSDLLSQLKQATSADAAESVRARGAT